MTSSELEFEVCNCAGTSSVCYKSLDGFGNSFAAGSCSDSTSCEFKARESGDAIYFELQFEVCNCAGTSSVCYKSFDGFDNSKAAGSCSDSTSCEFKARESGDAIYFGRLPVVKNSFSGCLQFSMKYPSAKMKDTKGNLYVGFESCTPKMVDDNIIELYISIDSSCSIIVKNAKVHVPITPTTTKVPPKHSPEYPKNSSEASFP
uniref:Uncharacterized protein n=1 Tax=Panagrolaimus sp. PS1159 TaxID=55785 RepID=A0AC35FCQ8_9BILA